MKYTQKKKTMDGTLNLIKNISTKKLNDNTTNVVNSTTLFSRLRAPRTFDSSVHENNDSIELDLSGVDLFATEPVTAVCDFLSDGLIHSLNTFGRVDVQYIADLTGKTVKEVVSELKGSIYQNPEKFNGTLESGWETADEYLSGNISEKLRVAMQYDQAYNGYFSENVVALRAVMPKHLDLSQIHVKIGTPWIPVNIMENFIKYLLNTKLDGFLYHDELTGSWEIKDKSTVSACSDFAKVNIMYGTFRMNAVHIIEKTLNMQTIKIMDETTTYLGKKQRVFNEKETLLALDKQKKIMEVFDRWIFRDEQRAKALQEIYEDKFCSIRTRNYDGSFLSFPNKSEEIELYPYQKNAVARILFSPNTLLAHDVGAGKTYIMVAAGMELKRMGISKRNMYVVPNNIVEQWRGAFRVMYPTAKVLCVSPSKFTPNKRQALLQSICNDDYDAVIIASSCFSMIPMSKRYVEEDYNRQISALNTIMKSGSYTRRVKDRIETLKKELAKYRETVDTNQLGITFDQLGVNTLFVDEAHNFKNVPFETQTGGILGVSSTGSKKCRDMLSKVQCVQSQNNGRGVVFATGTPITNSLSDLFILQKYLQSGVLESLNLATFDAWIANFAELVAGFEIDVDTSGYRMARRFSKFHNLPELTSILSLIADFHAATCVDALPNFNGYIDCVTDKTKDLDKYIQTISKRADLIRNRAVSSKDDNMLKVTTDGRKAALDLRLVEPKAKFSIDSKIFCCAQKVSDVYFKSYDEGGTQLVFCDSSTPKSGFNAYDELKRILLVLGVPESEIAFVHDATTEAQRERLFERMRNSKIRILIGSTWKLGIGVNIQDRLIAIHHLDVPWRPADMVQREGRILRPGNLNKEIYIFRYITKGTFDAYSWQLLETKQRFITKLLAGSISARKNSDIGDTVLNYAEVKALALGNPLVKARVEATNELNRLLTLKNRREELRLDMMSQLENLPAYIEKKRLQIENCEKDIEFYSANKVEYNREELKRIGKTILDGLSDNEYETEERKVAEYQGFDILLPAAMLKSEPFIYVEKHGRYRLEYKITDIGIMIRLNNLLDGLRSQLLKLQEAKERLENKQSGLELELAKQENYGDRIAELRNTIEKIDKKLGVKHGQ